MIKSLKIFFIGISLFSPFVAFSQTDYFKDVKLPTVLPPSPDVAAMEKFGSIPVSYSTGVPEISVPVWNITCGNTSWPMSLSYHAGGIKVDEIASNVGLGWSFLGPGAITRSVTGRPDEYEPGEPDYTTVDFEDYQYLYGVRDDQRDSEYDIFNYNFNGRSGKFIIKQDGSIFQIPYSGLKIENNLFQSFLVTDENGVTYLFDKTETTESERQSLGNLTILPTYTSTWHLSKVELPDKQQKIEFTYTAAGYSSQYFDDFVHALGDKPGSGIGPFVNEWSQSTLRQKVNAQLLTSISFPNGNIVINYVNDRSDKIGSSLQRISEIIINRTGFSGNEQVKKLSLTQSYFFYKPASVANSDPTQYRLKLTGISEYGSSSLSPKEYVFDYNTTPLAPRGNYGQDKWGFNNGHYDNYTLIPVQTAYYNTVPYSIGHANRSVDADAMQGWMLKKITWPTGGKTEFIYEPHQYYAGQVVAPISKTAAAVSDINLTDINTFTFPSSNAFESRLKIFISRYNFTGVTSPTEVILKDLTTNTQIYFTTNTTAEQDITKDIAISLVPGHSYELKVQLFTTVPNGQLKVTASVNWNNYSSLPNIETGGGLRIKEIKHYTTENALATRETYQYEPATTLTPFNFINQTSKEVIYKRCNGFPGGPGGGEVQCPCGYSPTNYLFFGNSIFPMSTALGSPMLYKKMAKFLVNEQGTDNNGKSEYEYDVITDNFFPLSTSYFYTVPIGNEWKNGFLAAEKDYKKNGSGFTLIRKRENFYTEYKQGEVYSLKVFPKNSHEGNCELLSSGLVDQDIEYFTYPIQSGSKKLGKTEETLFDATGQITTITESEYASVNHDFVTKTTITDSKNNKKITTYKYPHDFSSSGNVYEKMVTKNIIAPKIEQKTYLNNTATPLATIRTSYKDWYNDSKILSPETIQASSYNNLLEDRIRFHNYDIYNRELEASKENDTHEAYIWGYNNQYPIAQAKNAEVKDIFHTSFEDAEGNSTAGDSKTGKKSKTDGYTKLLTNLTNGDYILTYWQKSGSNWSLQKPVVTVTSNSYEISLTGQVDEIRFHPKSAQMTTYTYDPLTGMTSQTNVGNRTTHYEYDDFGRLSVLRDQDGNLIKKIDYKYQATLQQ